jgi:type I restriction enzyme R subunit
MWLTLPTSPVSLMLTNKAYFDELQGELGDEMQHYSNLFKSKEEIEEEIKTSKKSCFIMI